MKNSNKPQKGCSTCTLLLLLCIFLLAACAEGYESPKGFDMGVSGTQMVKGLSLPFHGHWCQEREATK